MMLPPSWRSFGSLVAGFGDRASGPPQEAVRLRQVHGNEVVVCDRLDPGEHEDVAGDALVATRPGVVVAVKTADCVPILILCSDDGRERWVAAVHAGWRGSESNVAGAAVTDAIQRGHRPTSLLAAIGPAIGPCCYEVDEDVASRFRRAGLPTLETTPRPHLDLRAINRDLLVRAGLPPQNIHMWGPCTRCHSSRYHSYRACPSENGRQQSWIGWAV